jgi:hypothetical protein
MDIPTKYKGIEYRKVPISKVNKPISAVATPERRNNLLILVL